MPVPDWGGHRKAAVRRAIKPALDRPVTRRTITKMSDKSDYLLTESECLVFATWLDWRRS